MNIELHELAALLRAPNDSGPWKIGTAYLIRTVTMTLVGRIVSVYPQELAMERASWVADTGRYSVALKTGELDEVEPMPGVIVVGRGAIVDAAEWAHALPENVK